VKLYYSTPEPLARTYRIQITPEGAVGVASVGVVEMDEVYFGWVSGHRLRHLRERLAPSPRPPGTRSR
jgi:hypothetical protein